MKFGRVDNIEGVDFSIPRDHPGTKQMFAGAKNKSAPLRVFVGCAKWNKRDLKGFYPRGTKNELEYYSQHFNSIEQNSTFYGRRERGVFRRWRDLTPEGFKFFPKLPQRISHFRRLIDVEEFVEEFMEDVANLGTRLGVPFLQLHPNFAPKDFERVAAFAENWKYDVPLAIEFRHTDWYNEIETAENVFNLFEKHKILTVLVDTAGRRDLLHMRLTAPKAFIRYVGANDKSDYSRLDDWIRRITKWKREGLEELYFFVHQNVEKESPLLAAYFIEKLNKKIGTKLRIPKTLE